MRQLVDFTFAVIVAVVICIVSPMCLVLVAQQYLFANKFAKKFCRLYAPSEYAKMQKQTHAHMRIYTDICISVCVSKALQSFAFVSGLLHLIVCLIFI